MRVTLRACLFAALPCAALAADLEPITPEQFLDRAEGRTLTFRAEPSGQLVGVEEFLSRTRTVWARANGACAYGVVELRGPEICFTYEDDPQTDHCWLTFREGDSLLVGNFGIAEIQRVTEISDRPVICEDAPLS